MKPEIEQLRRLVVEAIIDKWKRGEPLPGSPEAKPKEPAPKSPKRRARK